VTRVALAALHRDRLPSGPGVLTRPVIAAIVMVRGLHSGHVGDYVAWLVVGVAALGALVTLPLT
jgi:multicomponent Na+:H+ antiporter subunit D